MSDHRRTVLAGIVPDRRDLWLYAQHHLEPEHFGDPDESTTRKIFELLEKYYDITGDVLPVATFSDLLSRSEVDESKQLLYEQAYADLASYQPAEHEFRYAVDALKDLRSKQRTGEAIATSFEILQHGVSLQDRKLQGHQDARDFLYSELGEIDKLNNHESAPEGDIRLEKDDVLQEYADKKSGDSGIGILSGIPSVDLVTGGFQNGELGLIAAYTGNGKSQLLTQICWDVSVMQGKNFLLATSETVRGQVRRRLIARHSRLPQFNYPKGLNVRDIRDATLDPEQEKVFQDVLEDMYYNSSYGKQYIAQVPRGATLGYVEAKMKRQGELWEINLVGIDYLALLKPDRRRDNNREELNDILKDSKVLATSFYDGKGVPILSPWQMSQKAFKDAILAGQYQLANLADTSEAEKTPDQIVALLHTDDNPNVTKGQFLKNRDGEIPPVFTMSVDYRNAYLGEFDGGSSSLDLLSSSGNSTGTFGGTVDMMSWLND
jgi:replicative DNA helicase